MLFSCFSLSVFFSPYIFVFFFIPYLLKYWVGLGLFGCFFVVFLLFSLSWFLTITLFVLTLLLFVWWGGFLAAENHREYGSLEENSYFSVVLPYLCRSFPRMCSLLLDKDKMIPSYNHWGILMSYWFQCSMKSHEPLVGFRDQLALV